MGVSIALIDLVIGLSLSVLLALGGVGVYRYTHQGFNYERSFLVAQVMVAPIVAVVMMFIGSNLALSLGMVGALSIIRFRTVIKDSRDMVYLFWMIAIGLGCGTYSWVAVSIASAFIACVLLALGFIRFGQILQADYVLVVSGIGENATGLIREVLERNVRNYQMRSFDITDEDWELVFELRSVSDEGWSGSEITGELRNLERVRKVSLLAPQLALPL